MVQPVDYPYDAADPFGHIRPNGKAHTGSDWLCPVGTLVCAVLPGVVTAVGTDPGNGKYVAQSLPDGRYWSYIHLSEIAVKVGDVLSEGTPVALSGNTGTNSFGPHLHCSLSTSPSVFVGAPTLSDPYAFLVSVPPTPPTPARKKKKMFSMAAIKGENRVWAVWSAGFYYEIKDRPGLTAQEVNDQMNMWNAQVVGAGNFYITRAQANEIKAICLK
jgi:murein DD-endopeptidase MepM/ murein hydrolase activator NlpD